MRRPGRSWFQRSVLGLNLVAVVSAIVTAWVLSVGTHQVERIERVQLSGSLTPLPAESPGNRVLNILLVGSDSSGGLDPNDPINVGRQGEQNSDVMIIAHLDEREGSAALLSLPRDLYVDIAGTNRTERLNWAFATGGPARLVATIEENFGIPIHYYVNVDFAGFQDVVAAVGSVEIFFPAPARDWNTQHNRSQTGFEQPFMGCVALGPTEALAYVRSRHYQTMNSDQEWVSDPTGDLGRIRRQQDFLQRLMSRAISLGARNPFVLSELIDSVIDSVVVDQQLTPQLLLDLGRTYSDFEPGDLGTYSFPTEFGWAGSQSVLYGQEEAARPILALFAGAPNDDPSTVLVRVVSALGQDDDRDALWDALVESGFDPVGPRAVTVGSGLELRHGPDGRQAAEVVYQALTAEFGAGPLAERWSEVELVVAEGLSGREVVLAVGAPREGAGGPDGEPGGTPSSLPGPAEPGDGDGDADPESGLGSDGEADSGGEMEEFSCR